MFIYFWERERERAEEGQIERETQNPKQAPGSRLQAASTEPEEGLELTNYKTMTWAEVGRLTNWAIQVPQNIVVFKFLCCWFSNNSYTVTFV